DQLVVDRLDALHLESFVAVVSDERRPRRVRPGVEQQIVDPAPQEHCRGLLPQPPYRRSRDLNSLAANKGARSASQGIPYLRCGLLSPSHFIRFVTSR